ncbi:hypothetical protein INT46_004257 [Mucor plumbeus]|uniref:Uncharacterized protein n=1 Tax=Mucor plumbeus TaxID=97098 RepID=A0A8H7QZC7_9FUNG|nr:hypothetical protein INT46_004257 [Mucor plumbeus]
MNKIGKSLFNHQEKTSWAFIDESDFHTSTKKNLSQSPVGTRAVVKAPVTRYLESLYFLLLNQKEEDRQKKDVEVVEKKEEENESTEQYWPDDSKPTRKNTITAH